MNHNETLQRNVQEALKWEPMLHAAEIGVTVHDGIVTLTGTVDSFAKKLEAESATKNVAGVKAIVEKIEIHFSNKWSKSDNEVATEAVSALKWNWQVPDDKVKIKVEDGWISLTGELNWNYQREEAGKAVSSLAGVKGVSNQLTIKSETHDAIEKKDIESALSRNWSIDNQDITVVVKGNNVTLNGTVNSWYQKDEAERIAWNAPGVWAVDNELQIVF